MNAMTAGKDNQIICSKLDVAVRQTRSNSNSKQVDDYQQYLFTAAALNIPQIPLSSTKSASVAYAVMAILSLWSKSLHLVAIV